MAEYHEGPCYGAFELGMMNLYCIDEGVINCIW
jgi:hypothetical protein